MASIASIEPRNEQVATAPRAGMSLVWIRRGVIWMLIAALVYVGAIEGLALRRWVWDITDSLRFVPDTTRHCYWALETTGPEGFLNQYDKMAIQTRDWDVFLDYVPLRLLIMRQWGLYLRHHFPEIADQRPDSAWQRSYEFTAPLLHFNAAMDGLAAVCAFFLTRYWVRKGAERSTGLSLPENGHFSGVWRGIVAAALIWFNPAILLSAYAWPTWDSWIIPMYLLAALLASVDWWFCSGVVLAIGAMLKGQQLAVASIFIIWPLLLGRIGAAMRWSIGLLLGMALIASPWLITYLPQAHLEAARRIQESTSPESYPPDLFAIPRVLDTGAMVWIGGIVLVVAIGTPVVRRLNWNARLAIGMGMIVIVAAVFWPWSLARNRSSWPIGLVGGIALAAAVFRLRAPSQRFVLAAALGVSLLSCMVLFHGSISWWNCGFIFGATRWHWFAETLTNSLPGLLLERYGWSKDPDVFAVTLSAIHWHWPAFFLQRGWWPAVDWDLSSGALFNAIYTGVLLLSGVAVGLAARRKDRRMLVALATPWIVFFAFPAEIHGRYLLFPAGICSIAIGESIGMVLLGLVLTAIATIQLLDDLLQGGNTFGFGQELAHRYPSLFDYGSADRIYSFVQGTHPDLAWAVLLITGAYLYMSFAPSARKKGEVHTQLGIQ